MELTKFASSPSTTQLTQRKENIEMVSEVLNPLKSLQDKLQRLRNILFLLIYDATVFHCEFSFAGREEELEGETASNPGSDPERAERDRPYRLAPGKRKKVPRQTLPKALTPTRHLQHLQLHRSVFVLDSNQPPVRRGHRPVSDPDPVPADALGHEQVPAPHPAAALGAEQRGDGPAVADPRRRDAGEWSSGAGSLISITSAW
jgi:hypothetical protein